MNPMGDRLLSTEEQFTLITESLTVTSTDQEKLLLLNKNTELRRVNKEVQHLTEPVPILYRSADLLMINYNLHLALSENLRMHVGVAKL